MSMYRGKLFVVVGPSGSGKDSLIGYAKEYLQGKYPIIFPRRYITRPKDQTREDHIPLSIDEFQNLIKENRFAMYWKSYGNYYGIGKEIESLLSNGISVVINSSREHLTQIESQKLYPDFRVIYVEANPEVVEQRLKERGPKIGVEIEERLNRADKFKDIDHLILKRLDNTGDLDTSGREFVEFLMEKSMF